MKIGGICLKTLFKMDLPPSVQTSKTKKFILNLNSYRNLHYRSLSSAKNKYKQLVLTKLYKRKHRKILKKPLTIQYDYWHGNARKHDVLNQISIIDKFALDALVSGGLLEDDNSDVIKQYIITDRGIDRENPRAEMRIRSYDENI